MPIKPSTAPQNERNKKNTGIIIQPSPAQPSQPSPALSWGHASHAITYPCSPRSRKAFREENRQKKEEGGKKEENAVRRPFDPTRLNHQTQVQRYVHRRNLAPSHPRKREKSPDSDDT